MDKIINEKERPIRYSDRKQVNIMSVLNILRIIYYFCAVVGILYIAIFSSQIFPMGEKASDGNIINTDDVYVFDGDTISYQNEKIRLMCINAPEVANAHKNTENEKGAQEAKDAMIDFIEKNREIIKECKGKDKYGRELCELTGEDNTNFGLELVREGYARVYLCTDKKYFDAEREAQKKRKGIWNISTDATNKLQKEIVWAYLK